MAILIFGTLFTALPLSLFGQTINLFALAGLSIAIGEMADATIVIVENCTSVLDRKRSATRWAAWSAWGSMRSRSGGGSAI